MTGLSLSQCILAKIAKLHRIRDSTMTTTGKCTDAMAKLVTLDDGVSCRLSSLTFGSFLPAQFQSIAEHTKESGSDSDSQKSIQLEEYGNPMVASHPAVRKLQFSEAATSTQPTPIGEKDYRENRIAQKGFCTVPSSSQ
ncbi:hypothetical protein RND71_035326 [Anisodus tanguticus]|uniref:Uncharacterized protein n=1 Tax=Anisodus tanguticus TaxID=243964 RepID=A0AAE1R4P7_9SOLA|nr:hypothetical protein RND71_035326 [Anisodus tanguticus]